MTLAELVSHVHQEYSQNVKWVGSGGQFQYVPGGYQNTGAGYYNSPAGSSQPMPWMQPWGAFPIAIRY